MEQVETYKKELDEMQRGTKEEYLGSLRRQSSGFSRGVSKYRGVARFSFFFLTLNSETSFSFPHSF